MKYLPILFMLFALTLLGERDCCGRNAAAAGAATVKSGAGQEEEQPITEETPEANPDIDKLTLPETQAEALAEIQRKNEKMALRQRIKESETLFEKAVKSYEKGSAAKALDNFNAALVILSSANIDASALYGLKDDYRKERHNTSSPEKSTPSRWTPTTR
jgi:hypothetical protein